MRQAGHERCSKGRDAVPRCVLHERYLGFGEASRWRKQTKGKMPDVMIPKLFVKAAIGRAIAQATGWRLLSQQTSCQEDYSRLLGRVPIARSDVDVVRHEPSMMLQIAFIPRESENTRGRSFGSRQFLLHEVPYLTNIYLYAASSIGCKPSYRESKLMAI